MSLECGECEHDLRGGHAHSCSRYSYPTCPDCGGRMGYADEEANPICDACGREVLWPDRKQIVWVYPNRTTAGDADGQ